MKILHVIPSISPVRGGPSFAIRNLVGEQKALGLDARIATTDDDGAGRLQVTYGACVDFEGMPVHFFPRGFSSVEALRDFSFGRGFSSWLDRNIQDFDLIHIHSVFSHLPTTAARIARKRQVPYVVRPLGMLLRWSLQQGGAKKRLYLRLLEQGNLDRASTVQVTSLMEAEEVSDLRLKAPLVHIPLGVDLEEPIPRAEARRNVGLDTDDPVILFLSRWHHKKGLEYLVEACGRLQREGFAHRLILAGAGDPAYGERIRRMIGGLPEPDRVSCPGFVEGEAKRALFSAADLFVLPSHSENFGIAVAEAMGFGLAVVVAPGVALSREIEAHRAGWLTGTSADAVFATLREVLGSGDEGRLRGGRAHELAAREWSWPTAAKRCQALYEMIAGGQRPPFQLDATGSPVATEPPGN